MVKCLQLQLQVQLPSRVRSSRPRTQSPEVCRAGHLSPASMWFVFRKRRIEEEEVGGETGEKVNVCVSVCVCALNGGGV